jgi:hypothetical protein
LAGYSLPKCSIIKQHVGSVKTEKSKNPVPVGDDPIEELLAWRSPSGKLSRCNPLSKTLCHSTRRTKFAIIRFLEFTKDSAMQKSSKRD